MILNVSGRTDIVAFYSEWFLNRYREGFVDVRNPFYEKLVNRIYFEDVDAILFCTKNPMPIVSKLDQIKKPILFQVTLTPYRKDIEPGVPDKRRVIEAVHQLAEQLGKEYVYIRYDPVFLSSTYSVVYHIRVFTKLCQELKGATTHIIISFLDYYRNVQKHLEELDLRSFEECDYQQLGNHFSKIAKQYGMTVQTCCEERSLIEYGFIKRDCLDEALAYQLTGKMKWKQWKARGKQCHCVEMVDIGSYNTCEHFCKYCYANYDERKVRKNKLQHDPHSSLLLGKITPEDQIKIRR